MPPCRGWLPLPSGQKVRHRRRKTSSSVPTDRGTKYALDVVAGKIIAGPHVRNACRRHLDDLRAGHARGLTYSLEKVERVYRFFETKLRLNGGQFEGRPFILHPSQAFKLGCLFGWLRADGTRRFRRAYIEEGKGNGKSPIRSRRAAPGERPGGRASLSPRTCSARIRRRTTEPVRDVGAHPR